MTQNIVKRYTINGEYKIIEHDCYYDNSGTLRFDGQYGKGCYATGRHFYKTKDAALRKAIKEVTRYLDKNVDKLERLQFTIYQWKCKLESLLEQLDKQILLNQCQ